MNENLDESNKIERERVTFLDELLEDDAKCLSDKYHNLVIFSKGKKYNDFANSLVESQYIELDNINSDDIMLGCNIFKNGIKYNIIKGIHPNYNKIDLDDFEISISIDYNGLLKLNKNEK